MRIQTNGEYAHHEAMIEGAANRLNCNKTRTVRVSCEVVGDSRLTLIISGRQSVDDPLS